MFNYSFIIEIEDYYCYYYYCNFTLLVKLLIYFKLMNIISVLIVNQSSCMSIIKY